MLGCTWTNFNQKQKLSKVLFYNKINWSLWLKGKKSGLLFYSYRTVILKQLHYMSTVHIVLNLLNPVTANNNWLVSNLSKNIYTLSSKHVMRKEKLSQLNLNYVDLWGLGLKVGIIKSPDNQNMNINVQT